MSRTWSILTPRGGHGAIAIVRVTSTDAIATASELGFANLAPGKPSLRDLLGVDDGVVIVWDEHTFDMMPHGGVAVVRSLVRALTDRGIQERGPLRIPEPRSLVDLGASVDAALALASSPLAVDALLSQPRKWGGAGRLDAQEVANADVLRHLITPPLVVAVGGANIGKSTLANALAGETASLVADLAGTTRDHVGITLNVGGLVIRYLDTPGLRPEHEADEIERAAVALIKEECLAADLILLCGDAGQVPPDIGDLIGDGAPPPVLRVALRADLGTPDWAADHAVSIGKSGPVSGSVSGLGGVQGLADAIRETLVPSEALDDPRPWRFWASE